MSASYPTATKTFATRASGDVIQPAHVNDLQDEIVALENGLLTGLAHTVLPVSTGLYDLGSLSIRWRSGYFSGSVNVGGSLILTGALTGTSAIFGTAPSGAPGANAAQDDLVVTGSSDLGLTFQSDNNSRTQTVAFGAAALDAADAYLRYSTDTRALTFATLTAVRLTLQSDGDLVLGGGKVWLQRTSATTGATITADSSQNVYVATGSGSGLTNKLILTADPGHFTPGVDNTQWLGAGVYRWKGIYAGPGSAAMPAVCLGNTTTGLFYDQVSTFDRLCVGLNTELALAVRRAGGGLGASLTVYAGASGTNGSGASVHIGSNASNGAAGTLALYDVTGTPHYLWVDSVGKLRLHTTAPTDTAATDVAGTIVGSQS